MVGEFVPDRERQCLDGTAAGGPARQILEVEVVIGESGDRGRFQRSALLQIGQHLRRGLHEDVDQCGVGNIVVAQCPDVCECLGS